MSARPKTLSVLLDGLPLLDVMRAAAGADPIARSRAMARLLSCEHKAVASAVLQALNALPDVAARRELMGPQSGLVDALAIMATDIAGELTSGAASLLAKAYANEPWLSIAPRIFAALPHWLGINTAREMFDTPSSSVRWGKCDIEARQRAMDLAEACEGNPGAPSDGGYVEMVREYLPDERDKALRERMATFVAKHEGEARKAELVKKPGAAKLAKPKTRRASR